MVGLSGQQLLKKIRELMTPLAARGSNKTKGFSSAEVGEEEIAEIEKTFRIIQDLYAGRAPRQRVLPIESWRAHASPQGLFVTLAG